MDNLTDFASLDNLLAYGVGQPARPEVASAQPTLPVAGIGAPLDDQALYNSFTPQAPRANNVIPMPLPKVIPSRNTVTPMPRTLPLGNSNGQIDTLREALKMTESSGDYTAKNKHTSASGAYQYTDGTWGGYGGYASARYAPKHVQDARANEDLVKSLRRFDGDPFAVIANHMLPVQARKPWLWTQPSYLMQGKTRIRIPPVIDYVRKVVKGTQYENELNAYMAAFLPRQRG